MLGSLLANIRKIESAVEDVMGADGAFIAINENVSQNVPHLHAHIVPRHFNDGLHGFSGQGTNTKVPKR